jgi:hypothetical protein
MSPQHGRRRRHVSRRRRRRQRRAAIGIGAGLAVLALVAAVLVLQPSFLTTASDAPTHTAAPTAPSPTPAASISTPTSDDPLEERLAIAGDTGTRNASQNATAKRMDVVSEQGPRPFDGFILLGDIIYPNGNASLAAKSVTIPFAQVLKTAKLIPVLGNHDVMSKEQDQIMRSLGRDTRWYVDHVGPVRIIALDSTRVSDPKQLAFLRKALAEKQPAGTWTIAAMHHPAYSAGEHGSTPQVRRYWVPLFRQAGLRLVLAGHDHDYQRSKPQDGVTYIVSGGGAKLRPTGRADFTAFSTSQLHFVDLDVYADRLEGKAINQDGDVIDSFTITR